MSYNALYVQAKQFHELYVLSLVNPPFKKCTPNIQLLST